MGFLLNELLHAGIQGLIREKRLLMREKPTPELLEFFNVGAGQKVERYEITAYENLIDMADKLGISDAVELLEQSLLEEEAALGRLSSAASCAWRCGSDGRATSVLSPIAYGSSSFASLAYSRLARPRSSGSIAAASARESSLIDS